MLINRVEKRAFARMTVDCEVTFREPGETRVRTGRGRNLSANGILFVTDRAIDVGTELEINVMPSSDSISPLKALLEVVRLESSANAEQFTIAGRFKQVLN